MKAEGKVIRNEVKDILNQLTIISGDIKFLEAKVYQLKRYLTIYTINNEEITENGIQKTNE